MTNRRCDHGNDDPAWPWTFRLRGVLRRINMRHGVATTLRVGACLVLCGLLVAASSAATSQPITPQDDLPDPEQMVEAYVRARGWVDRFDPPPLDDSASRLLIENATGVCVILRNSGRIVGTGTATLSGGADPTLMVRRAAGRALSEVLGDPVVSALPEERRTEVGRMLTLELEVAGRFRPLLGRNFHQIAQQIEPGLEGAAMRRGDQRALLFPVELRATGAAGNIQSRLPGLAADLGLVPAELATLQQRHGVSVHRFRTTHLAQESPTRFPFETFRGDRVLMLSEVTPESIASFADGIASHLIGKLWTHHAPDDEEAERLALGMTGDYLAAADTYRPIVAPPLDQALSALALLRYSEAPGADSETAQEARDAATTLLRDLERVEPGEDDPLRDPSACAAVVCALAEHPELARQDEAIERLRRRTLEVVYGSFDPEMGFALEDGVLPPHTQAMLAAAIAQRLLQRDAAIKPVDVDFARAAIDAAWASVPPAQHVTLLPWIGWAEIALAEASREPLRNVAVFALLRSTLVEGRDALREEQPPDLRGGFPLAMGTASVGDRPTSQASRPAAYFATMLGNPDLTPPQERAAAIEEHRETMRFLMQHAVRESNAWSMRNPAAALGGVRASVWDMRLPTAAQAMTLLAAVETLWALPDPIPE